MFEPFVVEEWDPSPAEYAAYRKREFELAQENVRSLLARYGVAHAEDTLHCEDIFEAAYAAVVVGQHAGA